MEEYKKMEIKKGIVFNIQRYSIDDGPGIRSTVFLKGCPLRCLWCSNPESQKAWPEVAHRDSLCNKCGRCREVCSVQAITIDAKGVHISRRLCNTCGKCVEVCNLGALQFFGKEMHVEEVFHEIQKDIQYYNGSGGGITISGGEPLYQPEFTIALLKQCQDKGIHTCIETSGYAEASVLEAVLPYTSLVLFDLKHMDPVIHQKLTGLSNKVIIRNLKLIIAKGNPVIIRVPVIPGKNDSSEELTAIARTVASMNQLRKVDLLPYHGFGMGKYQMLDQRYQLSQLVRPTDIELQRSKQIFEAFRVDCEIRI
jgi:pyruvate formate lyase activating enzyme